MVGNIRMAHCTQIDRVERAKLFQPVWRHHLPGLDVSFATPLKRVPIELEMKAPAGGLQNSYRFRNHLPPDPIARDGGDAVLAIAHSQLSSSLVKRVVTCRLSPSI